MHQQRKTQQTIRVPCTVSITVASRSGWFAGAMTCHGNPYDGYTLTDILDQVTRIAKSPHHVFVDRVIGHTDTKEMFRFILTSNGPQFMAVEETAGSD